MLTEKLGLEKFQEYVRKFNYGNQDISGDKGKNNGLSSSWLSSSLQISPAEQIEFLQRMIDEELPVTQKSIQMTTQIMFIQELPGGWKIYGKTCSGRQLDKHGLKTELQHGWVVGFIEKEDRKILFSCHIQDHKKQKTYASFRARNGAVTKLWYLINGLS